ncbi:MAG: Fe-S cluster assembly protein SufD [Caulobacterales bacterium 32-69-10]|nr:MAG: Fe-S cluster assembly protein SufD [Caulobacterales bacterium 32-69-10]
MNGGALPGRRDESFRWSDLSRILRAVPPASPPALAPGWPGPFEGLADREMIFVNGFEDGPDLALLGDEVVAARFISDAHDTGHLARLKVQVMAGASAVLLESYEGRGDKYFANTVLDIELGVGASLERIVVLDEPDGAVSVSTAQVRLAEGSHYAQTVAASGARLQRHETHVHHPGGGATARLDAVYLLDGARHTDITTIVVHEGLEGETSQLAKGVVGGSARGVFQGKIVVSHGADKTDARMRHDALLLSDKAEVDAKPELEIYADDVSCAHGNTVGALDEEALFYARARGMPLAVATAMLTQAFVAEAVDRVGHEMAREALRGWTGRRLEALS